MNSKSGTAVSRPPDELEHLIRDGLHSQGWQANIHFVAPAEVEGALKKAVAAKPDLLVIGGGDGSVRAAAHAIKDTGIPLGILPLGTFNALARDLRIPLELAKAIEVVADGELRAIDVAEVNQRPFLGLCVMGMHADNQPESAPGTPWWIKSFQMAWHTMRHLPDYRRLWLELEMDKSVHAYPTRFVAISNNALKEEPGLAVPPRETLDSGQLVVYIGIHRTIWNVLRASVAYAAGKFRLDPNIIIERARTIKIHRQGSRRIRLLIDGERVTETLPLVFKVHSRRLHVVAPRVETEALPAHAA